MKILNIFNEYLNRGGEAQAVEDIVLSLGKTHDVREILFRTEEWSDTTTVSGMLKHALAMVWNRKSIKRVTDEIRQFQPDLILIHNLMPVGSGGLLYVLSRQGIPIIHYIHNFRPFSVNGYLWANGKIRSEGLRLNFLPEILGASWQDSRLKTLWYALILWGLHLSGTWKRIRHWIAISQFMKDSFVEAGIPESKISVIKHAWKINHEPLQRCDFEEEMPIVYLGRLSTQKGVDVLLKSWDDVQTIKPNLKLVICGEGPLEDEVRRRAQQTDSIEFKGFVTGEDKAKLLDAARGLVIPSVWYEPLGLVVYDGYEYGLPVVVAASGGLSEIVVDGETGFLFESGNVNALTQAILNLSELPDLGFQMGLEGRRWLEDQARQDQWDRQINEVLDLLGSNGRVWDRPARFN